MLKELYYKEIILTLGNHDYYVADCEYKSLYQNGIEKAAGAKNRYQDAGMIVLDGTIERLKELNLAVLWVGITVPMCIKIKDFLIN